MSRVRLSEKAETDLIEIWTYIAQDSPDAADQFICDVILVEPLEKIWRVRVGPPVDEHPARRIPAPDQVASRRQRLKRKKFGLGWVSWNSSK